MNSLKDYKVLGKKGEGTFSQVLMCQSNVNGKFYACKKMRQLYDSIEQVNNLREIIAMRTLSPHNNIIFLHEVIYDRSSGSLSLIMELMDMNLYEMIRDRKCYLPEFSVRALMWQLVLAVEFVHRKGIFHRDVKPENILIKSEVLKLADFGSCRHTSSKPPLTEYISTRWYRAPECLLTDGFYSAPMDVWSVGCVLYETLSLRPLFPGSNEVDQISKIHDVLGTPDPMLLKNFKNKSRSMTFNFPSKKGVGFGKHLAHVSSEAIDIIKKLCEYDAEKRISARSALKHAFFNENRLKYQLEKSMSANQPAAVQQSSQSSRSEPILNTSQLKKTINEENITGDGVAALTSSSTLHKKFSKANSKTFAYLNSNAAKRTGVIAAGGGVTGAATLNMNQEKLVSSSESNKENKAAGAAPPGNTDTTAQSSASFTSSLSQSQQLNNKQVQSKKASGGGGQTPVLPTLPGKIRDVSGTSDQSPNTGSPDKSLSDEDTFYSSNRRSKIKHHPPYYSKSFKEQKQQQLQQHHHHPIKHEDYSSLLESERNPANKITYTFQKPLHKIGNKQKVSNSWLAKHDYSPESILAAKKLKEQNNNANNMMGDGNLFTNASISDSNLASNSVALADTDGSPSKANRRTKQASHYQYDGTNLRKIQHRYYQNQLPQFLRYYKLKETSGGGGGSISEKDAIGGMAAAFEPRKRNFLFPSLYNANQPSHSVYYRNSLTKNNHQDLLAGKSPKGGAGIYK